MPHWTDKLKATFVKDAAIWIDRSYLVDWAVATVLLLVAFYVEERPVFERDFSVNDPLISHQHTHQQISGTRNAFMSYVVPAAIVGIVGLSKASLMDIHHGFLALYSGRALSHIITEALKNRVGRLRPDFLARCAWDAVTLLCTGNPETIRDGRRSFPSGHSSTAFTGMTFLSLFLAGKTAAWCFAVPAPSGALAASRLARLLLTFLPLAFATWVAISRVEDYRHHKEDVIVGSLIGILSAGICYSMYWPNPFSADSFLSENAGRPRMVYGGYQGNRPRNGNYELTGFANEIDTEPV